MLNTTSNGLSFNFPEFFESVIQWAGRGSDTRLLNKFLDILHHQIEQWIYKLPDNPEYAYKVIDTLKVSSFPNIDFLREANARLNFIKGRIYQNNLGTKRDNFAEQAKINAKYALLCFYDAIFLGNNNAWENIGDIYYDQALRGDILTTDTYLIGLKKKLGLQSEMTGFNEAMMAYSSGPVSAQIKLLVNCLTSVYWDNVTKGNFALAKQTADKIAAMSIQDDIKDILRKNEKNRLNDIIEHAKGLDQLKQRVHEVMVLSSAYVAVTNAETSKEMMEHLASATMQLATEPLENPANDYYLSQIWTKIAWMRKKEKQETDSINVAEINAETFLKKISEVAYPEEAKPFYEFVLGLKEQDNAFTSASPIEIEEHFQYAAKHGCFVAQTYLADLLQIRLNDNDLPALYHLMAAKAGDPRAYFTFLHRIVNQKAKLKNASSVEDFTEFCESALSVLRAALTNPYISRNNNDYFYENIEALKQFYRENTHRPKELNPENWKEEEKSKYEELYNLVCEYHQLPYYKFNQRILLLHHLQQKIDLLLTVKNDNSDFLKNLLAKVNKAEVYLAYKRYLLKIEKLAKQKPLETLVDYVKFFVMPNGLRPQNYFEFIDPLHRREEFVQVWIRSRKNISYFAWLHEIERHKPARIPQVVYLDEVQRQRLQVDFVNGEVKSFLKKTTIPDGDYLFVMDDKKRFYFADAHAETDEMHHFHHSSFLAGNPVVAAGAVTIENGKIVSLNNFSGHYQPDILRLYQCYLYLKENNMVTEELRIGVAGLENLPDQFKNINMSLTPKQFEDLVVYVLENKASCAPKTKVAEKDKVAEASSEQPLESYGANISAEDNVACKIYDYLQSNVNLDLRMAKLNAHEKPKQKKPGLFSFLNREKLTPESEELKRLTVLKDSGVPYMLVSKNLSPTSK